MTYTILRNGIQWSVPAEQLQPTDLVLAADQNFYPVTTFPSLMPVYYQPQQPTTVQSQGPSIWDGLGKIFVIAVGVSILIEAAKAILGPLYNDEPLTKRDREYIRARDREICLYCSIYAPNGHVDHRISRANGGGNDYDNLAWACVSCNCSKGSKNDTEFLALLQQC